MTLLEKTYSVLNQETEKKASWSFKPIRPTKKVEFSQFNIPASRQVKKTREHLSKVLAFIDSRKQLRFADGYTVMPISCKSRILLSICGSIQNAANLIGFMKKIGLLADYDETYQFNAYYDKDNRCKTYCYSFDNEVRIKEYCNINNINKYKIINKRINIYNSSKLQSFDEKQVLFNSKLHLYKPDNWSCSDFENYIYMLLLENYPEFEYYQELADEINEKYYNDDVPRQIIFKPNFTWNKGNKAITKIGIRACNELVSAKKEIEDDDKENQLYRYELLEKYGLPFEYDIKSSVPRITYALNKGVWLDEDIDLYEVIFDKFTELCPSEKLAWNEETRKIFKSFFMNIYFDNENELYKHFACKISQKVSYKKEDWADLDRVLKYYKQATEEVIGKSFDSEIFYWESIVYMEVSKYLLDNGYDVLQCYDCWYCNKSIDSNKINEIIKNKINNIRNNNKINNKDNNIYNSSKLQNSEVEDSVEAEKVFEIVSEAAENDKKQYFREFQQFENSLII